MHSDGGGKSFAISSSGGSIGFSNSSGGGNVAKLPLVELVDAFDLCLLLLLLWLDDDDDVAVDIDDADDDEPTTVKLLPIGLLLDAVIDILSDLDEVGMGCSIPKNHFKWKIDFNHSNKGMKRRNCSNHDLK